MLLFFGSSEEYDKLPEERKRERHAAVGRWWNENGVYLRGGEQLQPSRAAKTVRKRSGPIRVIDGPFIESKEAIGGYAIVEVADRAKAIELAKTWPASDVEVRPVVEEH